MIRRTFSILALVAVTSMVWPTSVFGQQASGSHDGQRFKQALAQLDLTAAQKQKIKEIVEQAKQQRQASSTAGSGAGRSHAGRAVLEKILNVLTSAQKAKLREILKSSRSQGTGKA